MKIQSKKLNFSSFKNVTNVKEVEEAAQEGIYADTPLNRKLGRVGMSYSDYSNKIKSGNSSEVSFKNKK